MIAAPVGDGEEHPELISYAKANPGKLNYASVGTGSVSHLAHEAFRLDDRGRHRPRPFKGGGPALQGVIGNEVQIGAVSIVPTIPHVAGGTAARHRRHDSKALAAASRCAAASARPCRDSR